MDVVEEKAALKVTPAEMLLQFKVITRSCWKTAKLEMITVIRWRI